MLVGEDCIFNILICYFVMILVLRGEYFFINFGRYDIVEIMKDNFLLGEDVN